MVNNTWFSPAEIRFSQEQVVWLLQNLEILRSGCWPPEYKETGYSGSKTTQKRRAPFDTPACILSELEKRIERAGIDGILLEFVYSTDSQDRLSLESHIASAMRLELRAIERRVEAALRYVCGEKRKYRSYKEFREHKKASRRY